MDVVKRKRSKGGFLNLFDWPGKSRKRLFSNSSEISEDPSQVGENVQNSSTLIEIDEIGKSSIHNLRSDSSCCASSVTSEDGKGGRAPSVVAKLMGLESLPVPNLDPFFLRSLQSANTWEGYKNSGHVNRDYIDSRTVKEHNWPIERFQTESLPPRSAKTISVTHNRLLSPIRSPGFVPSKNPAYVMEAASRMIEPSSRVVADTRTRVSSVVSSSSVPLRIRDLKQKLESAGKTPNGQHLREKRNEKKGLDSPSTPRTSQILGKVNPSSLSTQAKTITRKQDSSMPSNGCRRISTGQKGNAEAKTVLKQNNQKQNCRDRHQAAKASVTKQQSKKVTNRALVESEIGYISKKSCSSPPSLTGKDVSLPLSQKKNLRNKKSPNEVQEPRICSDIQFRRGEKSIKCNITIDNDLILGKDDKKKDMDVISFTFSSPIKGISSSTSRSSTQGIRQDIDSAVSFNVIDGDYLNVLLEQKLKELTSKIESTSCSLVREESLGPTSKNEFNLLISSSSKGEVSIQNGMDKGLSENDSASDCTLLDDNQKVQMIQSEEVEISSISTLTDADDSGCNWSCSDCKDKTADDDDDGTKQSLSDQELTWVSSSEPHRAEDETEFSESVATVTFLEAEERPNWEVDYITEVLSSGQLMLKEFALGMARDALLPASLFHEADSVGDPMVKIERKVVLDCINQWLTLKCEGVFTGSCKGLVGKEGILWERREWLAEELRREIEGLKNMQEMMVDELVEKDMGSLEGRWLDYEKEAYEEGAEIEREIVYALVDDLVDDLLSVF